MDDYPTVCVGCGRPSQVVVVISDGDHTMHIGACRPCLGAVLLDIAETFAPGAIQVQVEP